jgi:nucleoside-diphosphate-sugar epimerase
MSRIFVSGSSGYVASNLIPKLLDAGHDVVGMDLFPCEWMHQVMHGNFHHIIADIRNMNKVWEAMDGCDAVIHLAAISNDPSFDMNPEIGKSINFDFFRPLVKAAKDAGVKRFIFASSSSVYGVREEKDVIETTPLTPLTDYSKYKAMCEEVLLEERENGFETVIVRPATVCGWATNMRLDLCVHILTMAALRNGVIKVFGGDQYRPNIHIDDITDAYLMLLTADKVDGEIFNVGHKNLTIKDTALLIKNLMRVRYGRFIDIEYTSTNDNRSYHVSSEKIKRVLGFETKRSVSSAIDELIGAYKGGLILDPDNDRYYAIKRMKGVL